MTLEGETKVRPQPLRTAGARTLAMWNQGPAGLPSLATVREQPLYDDCELDSARRDRLELTGEIANLKQAAESRLRLEESRGTSPIPEDSALRHRSDEGDGI